MTGKKYFYALGQRARSKKLSKSDAERFYRVENALPYCRIAFDAGYRGLPL